MLVKDLQRRKQCIQQLQNNLDAELSSNVSFEKKLLGTPILFSSSQFHLVHVPSLKFVSINNSNIDQLIFELVDFPNDNAILRFNPCLNFQKQRTNVVYSCDVVCLSATMAVCNRSASLHTNYQGINYDEVVLSDVQYEETEAQFIRELEEAKLTGSLNEFSPWRVNFYSAYTEEIGEEIVQVGDVMGLMMSEQNLFLRTIRNYDPIEKVFVNIQEEEQDITPNSFIQSPPKSHLKEGKEPRGMFLKWPDAQSFEEQGRNVLFQANESLVETPSLDLLKSNIFNNKSANKKQVTLEEIQKILVYDLRLSFEEVGNVHQLPFSAYWKLESEQYTLGGPVQYGKYYRIRNFQTGKYLEFISSDNIRYHTTLVKKVTKNSLFYFESLVKKSKYLTKESYFILRHLVTGLAVAAIQKNDQFDKSPQQIYLANENEEEGVLRLRMADFEETWESRFLLYCIPQIMKALDHYNQYDALKKADQIRQKIKFYGVYRRVTNMLDQLDDFVNNKLLGNIQIHHRFAHTSPTRQNAILTEHVLPLLIWLLIKSFPDQNEIASIGNNFNIRRLRQEIDEEREFICRIEASMGKNAAGVTQKTVQKLEDSHRRRKLVFNVNICNTISNICKENESNQVCFGKFLCFIQKQIGSSAYLTQTLQTVFSKNETILKSLNRSLKKNQQVTESIPFLRDVVFRFQNSERLAFPHLPEFLAHCCTNDEQAIFQNQDLIFRNLVEDPRGFNALLKIDQEFNIECYDQDGVPNYLPIKDLNSNEQKFLKAQINLFAGLCAHRNFNAVHYFSRYLIEGIFFYKVRIRQAVNSDEDIGLRASFYNLIRNLYVNREPYIKKIKPNLVRLLDPLQPHVDVKQKQIARDNKLYLYEDEVIQESDEQQLKQEEIGEFLLEFKQDLLDYLSNKYQQLQQVQRSENVYNILTLEVIKILHLLLRFGMFDKQKYTTNTSIFEKKNEDINKLIEYLALLLEYDESYFNSLQLAKIQRKYRKQSTVQINGSSGFFNNGIILIKKIILLIESRGQQQREETISNPIFKKIKSLRRILINFDSKTFLLREDLPFEIQIKIEVCKVFSYLMDMRQDYLIDNTLRYFTDTFVPKTSRAKSEELTKLNFDADFLQLFPENMLASGEDAETQKPMKEISPAPIKGFDQILQRPFSEVLLLALYFTQNAELQNMIVDLIERFSRQKKEFCQHLEKIQLLLSPEQHQLYHICNTMVSKLRGFLQYSQVWFQLDEINFQDKYLDDTLDRLWKLESILMKKHTLKNSEYGVPLTLALRQEILKHIGGYVVVQELVDKALNVLDQNQKYFEFDVFTNPVEQKKSETAAKFIKLIRCALSVFLYLAKENADNQNLIFKTIGKRLLQHQSVNFGQVELLVDLFGHDSNLLGQLTNAEFSFWAEMIKLHGQYKELLEFYDLVLRVCEKNSPSADLHKKVMVQFLREEYFDFINPFGKQAKVPKNNQRVFYEHKPNQEKYTEKYLSIVARCIRKDIGVNLIIQTGLIVPTNDILEVFVIYSERIVKKMLAHESATQLTRTARNACDILRVISKNSKKCLEELFQNSHTLSKGLQLQLKWLKGQEHFSVSDINFLLDSLIPIVNVYNDTYIKEGSQALMLTASMENQQYNLSAYEFAEYFISRIDKIFFLNPQLIQQDQRRIRAVNRLADTFYLKVGENIFEQTDQEDDEEEEKPIIQNQDLDDEDIIAERNGFKGLLQQRNNKLLLEQDDEDSEIDLDDGQYNKKIYIIYQECWSLFRQKFKESNVVKKTVKEESKTLSRTIWTIRQMFSDKIQDDQKELLLQNEDLIIKIFNYIQYWEENKASKQNVIFILKVLTSILKEVKDEDEILMERQMLYDRLHAAKRILILMWEEKENDAEYLYTLSKFLILMIHGGNSKVQKSLYDFFLNSTSCEKIFHKLYVIMNMQINSVNSSHKLSQTQIKLVTSALRILQLFCEGHNQEMQAYVFFQKNQKNSYDLVTHTVQLLSSIKVSESTEEIFDQCFDTLTEMVQGPCKLTQVAIVNSKFLEYAVQVLAEDHHLFECRPQYTAREKKKMHDENKRDRGTLSDPSQYYLILLHPGKLARLKYKCLNTIVSLLECNESQDSLIMRILRAIPLNVLTNNLSRIYLLFMRYEKGEYQAKVFNRIDETITNEKDDEYYELIIENGFYIYFLIQLFLANKKGKAMLYEDSEMCDVLNEFTGESTTSILDDTIISEFGKFGTHLMQHGKNVLVNLKSNLIQKSEAEMKLEQEKLYKKEHKQLTKQAIAFFKQNTCSIDMTRDDKLYQIIFPKLPLCKQLPQDIKIDFHEEVDRTSSKTKVSDLMHKCDKMIEIMKHEERLRIFFSSNPLVGLFASHGKLWEQCAFYSTLLVNIIVCLSYSEYFMNDEPQEHFEEALRHERLFHPRFFFNRENTGTLDSITTFGVLNLIFNSLTVFFFLVKRAPLKVQHLWIGIFNVKMSFHKRCQQVLLKFLKTLFILLKDFDIIYYSFYIGVNIIALTIHPFFYAYHLIEVMRMQQLKTVIQAIWSPRIELILSLVLLIIVEYYFSIIGYLYFHEDYEIFWDPEAPFNCGTIWHCFFSTYDWSFKLKGGAGTHLRNRLTLLDEVLPKNYQEKSKKELEDITKEMEKTYPGTQHKYTKEYVSRFFFDNLLNIIVVFILMEMLHGITVDTFCSLREKLKERNDDQTLICFICGIDRQKLDKNSEEGKGFYYHIKEEHYMWNYVFYKAYLDFKKKDEYNGNESYVLEKLQNFDISWFPIKRARGVEDDEDDALGQNLHYYEEIIQNLNEIQSSVEKTQLKVDKMRENIIEQEEAKNTVFSNQNSKNITIQLD